MMQISRDVFSRAIKKPHGKTSGLSISTIMRSLVALLFLSVFATYSRAADVEFVRVWPGWREAESFDRIGEYLGQGEQTGRQVVIRTHPETRTGYYFLTRIKHNDELKGAK